MFYSGSRLAPDLSLPRIRERWSGHTTDQHSDKPSEPATNTTLSDPATARHRAATAAWQTILIIDHDEEATVAAHIAAAGEVLDALAATSAAHTRRELRKAAFAFERATRSHIRAQHGHDQALRQAARDPVHSGPALGRGEDGATTAMVIDMQFFLVTAATHWHAKKGHAQQSAAARLQRQTAMLRKAVPELAEQILSEPGWYALAATITDAEAAGHGPQPS
ncbi:hypothetical protein J2S47_003620 [Streptomyces griseoviridis]|uniref:PE-PGRS family protein n=1 Tax=Streptomyces griseoviridis TaxID=45398 RepID=A0ABT9LHB5_STRGD|nr:hypothetical protein [Streptomyces griseoviridis]